MTAPVMAAAPGASNRCRVPVEVSSSTRRARTMEARENGTVTRNTADQPNVPVRMPPRKTPVAPPTAEAAPQALIALARAGPGKVSRSSDMAAGLSEAAPAPWMMRPATSICSLLAAAARRVPAVNRTDPAVNMRRRPNRSAARPDSRSSPPKVST